MVKKILIIFLIIIGVISYSFIDYYNIIPKKTYDASHFNIKTIKSKIDANNNGIDDYEDILLGAREYVQGKPKYKSKYYSGGYPIKGEGVCTDVIWYAFKSAGYDLKGMIDKDIKENINDYKRTNGVADPNIDFRRVPNINVFLNKYATKLTIDINKIDEFQPGDILVYHDKHIGIVSDKRNKKGVPYIIHHGGQPIREEDAISRMKLTEHYRFDTSKIDSEVLVYDKR